MSASDVTSGSVPVPMELLLLTTECLWHSRMAECEAVVSCCAGCCRSLVLGESSGSCLSSCGMFGGWYVVVYSALLMDHFFCSSAKSVCGVLLFSSRILYSALRLVSSSSLVDVSALASLFEESLGFGGLTINLLRAGSG